MKELKKMKNLADEFFKEADAFIEMQKIKEAASQPVREVGYRVLQRGLLGLDFGFIYSNGEMDKKNWNTNDETFFEKVEKPLKEEYYWYITCWGLPEKSFWTNFINEEDSFRWKTGNVFNTKESAEEHLKRLNS